MKIKSVSYVGSFADPHAFPRPRGPEIAFMGRSNVGKSSLINTLLGRRNLARTSNTPGKTRTMNYYLVNDEFFFVDMPGYGYAQVSKAERARWEKLIAAYVAERKSLCGVVQLLDVRHTPTGADRDLLMMVEDAEKPLCLVFNKTDKLNRSGAARNIAEHLRELDAAKDTAVVAFSSETGEGKRELWVWLVETMRLQSGGRETEDTERQDDSRGDE